MFAPTNLVLPAATALAPGLRCRIPAAASADAAPQALATQLHDGALPRLEELSLAMNQLWDPSLVALSKVLALT